MLRDYLDGRLPPKERRDAQRHLDQCRQCREVLDAQRLKHRALKPFRGASTETAQPHTASVAIRRLQSEERLPSAIGGYDILSEIHRGGQGVVYKAVQKATKRTVALKLLLEGQFASQRQRYRFEREIDLVAGLRHANIVTVYDSGVTPNGRHFFAMEYVHGKPLDKYLRQNRLSVRETLHLFQTICGAISHAHQRGVIHRDLKPANIIIDADREPHVLDFGIAKSAGAEPGPDGAPMTMTGQFMGTLAYASPEQTKGDPNLVDVRTDVYSLGVVLFKMLTDKYPYAVDGELVDVLKNIVESDPLEPSKIRREINHEVDTILLTALAKDKRRRYQSAEAFGRDVAHYLKGEPIDAKSDSGWYVLRKTVRRYRAACLVASAFFVLVSGAGVWMSVLYSRAARAEEIAATEAETSDQVLSFMGQSLAAVIENDETNEALESLYRSALSMVRQRTGNDNPTVATLLNNLSFLIHKRDRLAESERLQRESLDILRKRFGDGHPKTAMALGNLGRVLMLDNRLEEAAAFLRDSIATLDRVQTNDEMSDDKVLGEVMILGAIFSGYLGECLTKLGQFDDANRNLLEAYSVLSRALGETHERTLKEARALVALYEAWEKPDMATPYRTLLSAKNHAASP